MSLIVKICGLSTEETLDAALDAGADMIGLVFFPKSPRFVTLETAERLAERARGRAAIVALTVDMADAELDGIAETVRPDWLQLHGRETAERIAEVRGRYGLAVMKAVGIRGAEDLDALPALADVADRLLLDAKPPAGSALPGGNGVAFDWRILDALDPALPYMLSGGLEAGNVAEALARTRPLGVDVSSGVESRPGIKDKDRIRAFIDAARGSTSQIEEARHQAGERIRA